MICVWLKETLDTCTLDADSFICSGLMLLLTIQGGGGSLIQGDQGGGGHLYRGIAHAQMSCGASGNMVVVVVALISGFVFLQALRSLNVVMSFLSSLKEHNMQHNGHMGQQFSN